MDQDYSSSLVSELFAVIYTLSGYAAPSVPPEIHFVSQTVMQAEVCGATCPIQAYYHSTRGVFIDERLDVVNDPYARSILLHELVHHVQAISGRFDSTSDPCIRHSTAEAEAYLIQNRYLMSIHDPHRVARSGWAMRCRHSGIVTPAAL
jgi:hypothetical protein